MGRKNETKRKSKLTFFLLKSSFLKFKKETEVSNEMGMKKMKNIIK